MEIKATLNKPYTDKQRLDFIVSQNHNKGYEIKETDSALEAWGLTEEEKEEQAKQEKISQYKQKLKEIDEKSARSIRAVISETATEEDKAYLAGLETQAEEYRQKIRKLQGE